MEAPFAPSRKPGLVVWRQRCEDLLKLAFPTKHALVRGFLKEFQTGAAKERVVLEWLRAAELELGDYLRLLDYGFLRRSPHPPASLSPSRRKRCGCSRLRVKGRRAGWPGR
ncbi:hypothetical protein [Infirmifilum sp. SLHALR2]